MPDFSHGFGKTMSQTIRKYLIALHSSLTCSAEMSQALCENVKMIKIEGIAEILGVDFSETGSCAILFLIYFGKKIMLDNQKLYITSVLSGGISSLDSEHGTNAEMMKIGRKPNF